MPPLKTFLTAEVRPRSDGSLRERLFSRGGALLLGRNTVVSIFVFLIGLGLLWLMVERLGVPKVPAAAASFLVSNSLHYVFGRAWIYRGTERKAAAGYAFFLLNAVVGLVITVGVFAAVVSLGLHYIAARVIASIFAGLALFILNAFFNFRSL